MPKLVVREGDSTRIYELSGEQLAIGRATDNAIVLDDTRSSRNHAVIRRTEDAYEVIDLESRNGTKVDGVPISHMRLREGSRIQIGNATITFSSEPEVETESSGDDGEADTDASDLEDSGIVEGLEVGGGRVPRLRRFGRTRRRGGRARNEATSMSLPKVQPEPESLPQPQTETAPPSHSAPQAVDLRAETHHEVSPIPSPEPIVQRRPTMKKFHLIEEGRVKTFARGETGVALPLDSIFADAAAIAPWDEILRTEALGPIAGLTRPGGAMLMELREAEGGRPSLLLVDSAGVLTVVEDGGDQAADAGAHRALVGKGINLAAVLATEWTAETLRREFEAYCAKSGRDPRVVLERAFGRAPSDGFWTAIETHLQSGRIRVIFAVREATVAIQKVIDFMFVSTNLSAYALQIEAYSELGAERPRSAVTIKMYGPSRSARAARTAKSGSDEPRPALDVVGT